MYARILLSLPGKVLPYSQVFYDIMLMSKPWFGLKINVSRDFTGQVNYLPCHLKIDNGPNGKVNSLGLFS